MQRVVWCTTAAVVCVSALAMCRPTAEGARQRPSPLVAKFDRAVADARTDEDRDRAARAFVGGLPDRDQLALARALVKSGRPERDTFGGLLLVDRHLEKEAAPAFARFVTGGGDMTAYFGKGLHGADDKAAPRAYVAIARELLARIDTLTGEPRRRAEAFLVADGYGPHIDGYSRKAVEAKLAAVERDIR